MSKITTTKKSGVVHMAAAFATSNQSLDGQNYTLAVGQALCGQFSAAAALGGL